MPPTEDWKELSFLFSPFLPLSVWESGGKKEGTFTHTLFPEKEEKNFLSYFSLAWNIDLPSLAAEGSSHTLFSPENGREKVVGKALK